LIIVARFSDLLIDVGVGGTSLRDFWKSGAFSAHPLIHLSLFHDVFILIIQPFVPLSRADPGICETGGGASPRSLPPPSYLPFLSPSLPPPLRSIGPRKPARGPGERYKLRSGVGAEPWPKTNIVHYKAVRKPLEAIILNILSTMFYSRTIKI